MTDRKPPTELHAAATDKFDCWVAASNLLVAATNLYRAQYQEER